MCIENDVLFPNSGVDRAFMNTFEPFNTAKLTAEVENAYSYTLIYRAMIDKKDDMRQYIIGKRPKTKMSCV